MATNLHTPPRSALAWLGWFSVFWLPSLLGAIPLAAAMLHPSAAPTAWASLGILGFLTVWSGSILLHELAHFAAAKALRVRPYYVGIGYGVLFCAAGFSTLRGRFGLCP